MVLYAGASLNRMVGAMDIKIPTTLEPGIDIWRAALRLYLPAAHKLLLWPSTMPAQ